MQISAVAIYLENSVDMFLVYFYILQLFQLLNYQQILSLLAYPCYTYYN